MLGDIPISYRVPSTPTTETNLFYLSDMFTCRIRMIGYLFLIEIANWCVLVTWAAEFGSREKNSVWCFSLSCDAEQMIVEGHHWSQKMAEWEWVSELYQKVINNTTHINIDTIDVLLNLINFLTAYCFLIGHSH